MEEAIAAAVKAIQSSSAALKTDAEKRDLDSDDWESMDRVLGAAEMTIECLQVTQESIRTARIWIEEIPRI